MSTRIRRDGRTAIQKVEDLKKRKDLEMPKGDPEENCRFLQPMKDPMQRGCKRTRGESDVISVGAVQVAASAALARARVRKKKLWMEYYLKKKAEGWYGIEIGLLVEG